MSYFVYHKYANKMTYAFVSRAAIDPLPSKTVEVTEVHENGKGWSDLPKNVMLAVIGLDRLPGLADGDDTTSGHGKCTFVENVNAVNVPKQYGHRGPKTFEVLVRSLADMPIVVVEKPAFTEGSKKATAFSLLRANMTTHEWAKAIDGHADLPKFPAVGFVKNQLAMGAVRRKA